MSSGLSGERVVQSFLRLGLVFSLYAVCTNGFFRVIEAKGFCDTFSCQQLRIGVGYRSHDESLALIDYLVIRYFRILVKNPLIR